MRWSVVAPRGLRGPYFYAFRMFIMALMFFMNRSESKLTPKNIPLFRGQKRLRHLKRLYMRNRKAFEHIMSNVRLRREYRKMRKLAFATGAAIGSISVVAAFSGCIAVVGTPEGMRSYYDGQNGLITNGKEQPGIKSAHWSTRENEEIQRTIRDTNPGFLGSLFGAKEPK